MGRRNRVSASGGPPSSYALANLPTDPSGMDIEPPLLPGASGTFNPVNRGAIQNPTGAPHGLPSVDTSRDPGGMLNRDTGMYNPNDLGRYNSPDIYAYQHAMDSWMDHPDDQHFFSFSDLHASDVSPAGSQSLVGDPTVSINDPNAPTITGNASTPSQIPQSQQGPAARQAGHTYGPADFIGNRFNNTFDIQRFVNQYPNFPAGPIASDPNFQVLINNESPTMGPGGTNPGTTEVDPVTGWSPTSEESSNANTTYQQAQARGDAQNAQLQQSTAGARASSGPQNLLGVGQKSGQHYYSSNGGRTWTPVTGAAPAEVRFAQGSGTGNWQADQYTKGYELGGGTPGAPNEAQSDELSMFRIGNWHLDPEGGYENTGAYNAAATSRPTHQLFNSPESLAEYQSWAQSLPQPAPGPSLSGDVMPGFDPKAQNLKGI